MNHLFQIPELCSENWNEMTPTEKGAFCKKCSKEVLDLRALSPEIAKNSILRNSNPCVRIEEGLLSEMNFREWVNSLSLKRLLRWAFILAVGLAFNSARAQQLVDSSIETDSSDCSEEIQDSLDYETDSSITLTLAPAIFDSITVGPWIIEDWQGGMPPPEIPPIVWEFDPKDFQLTYEVVVADFVPENPKEDVADINGNIYSFLVRENDIRFRIFADHAHVLKIRVETDPEDTLHENRDWKFYYPPMEIDQGSGEFFVPLKNIPKGKYIIHLETTRGTAAAKLLL